MRPKSRVLVADRQTFVRRELVVTLVRAGYRARGAASGAEALALLLGRPRFALLVSGRVRDMTSRGLAACVRDVSPETSVLLMNRGPRALRPAADAAALVRKAFPRGVFLDAVAGALPPRGNRGLK